MKEIRDINESCQVEPNDFSFLSGADKDILKVFSSILRHLHSLDDTVSPIVIRGLEHTVTNIGNAVNVNITEGIVLYKDNLYSVAAVNGATFMNQQAFAMGMKLVIPQDAVLCEPSPVYDENLDMTINRHYSYVATLGGGSAGDTLFNFINGLQRLAQ